MLLHAGKCAQIQVLPDSNTAGQQHMACKLLHSSKQAAFVFFYRVLEGGGRGAVLTPGSLEWTLVQEVKLGEEKSMTWTLPGALCKIRSSGISDHSRVSVDQTPPLCFFSYANSLEQRPCMQLDVC